MVGTNARERDGVESCVVGTEHLDKSILALQCISYSQGHLMMMVNEVCFTIDKYGVSCEILIGLLFYESSRDAAMQYQHVLVEMDNVGSFFALFRLRSLVSRAWWSVQMHNLF
jgi:hypothetical protein